ncbi:MAG TPA: hypothetical protein GXX36_13460 [Clostridiaceae bacterium]|nr:hypothetical protein [Clostridiaceae bacterium]
MNNVSNRKCSRKKMMWVIAIIGVVVAVTAIFISFQVIRNNTENKIVATVNGDPVYVEEFRERLLMQKVPVQQFFREKYGIQAGDGFWESYFEGENPLKTAKEMALNECVQIKVEQQLGRDKGLVEDISYPAFLKQLEKENKRRKKAVENNEIIYGPVEYQKNVYYEYLYSNMKIALKELLEGKEIQFTEEDLMSYYEQIKDSLYRKEGEVKILKAYVTYTDENRNFSEENRKAALEKIRQVKLKMDQGENIKNISDSSPKGESLKVNFVEQVFNEKTAKHDQQSALELKTRARRLSVGEISDIIEENNTFYVIKCLEREADGYKSFEEVRENVKSKFIDEKYNEMVEGLVKAAKVEIVGSVYDRINMQ